MKWFLFGLALLLSGIADAHAQWAIRRDKDGEHHLFKRPCQNARVLAWVSDKHKAAMREGLYMGRGKNAGVERAMCWILAVNEHKSHVVFVIYEDASDEKLHPSDFRAEVL